MCRQSRAALVLLVPKRLLVGIESLLERLCSQADVIPLVFSSNTVVIPLVFSSNTVVAGEDQRDYIGLTQTYQSGTGRVVAPKLNTCKARQPF